MGAPATWRKADPVLRATAVVTCLTAAWVSWARYSSVNSQLFMGWGLGESTARWVDRAAAVLLIGSAAAMLGSRAGSRVARVTWGLAALWLLALALALSLQGGAPYTALALPAHAVRYGTPVVVLLLASGRARLAGGLLRAAVAITFSAHGLEALGHHPAFIDLIIGGARRSLELGVSEVQARALLTVIGVLDLLSAALLVTRRWPLVPGYMAAWGAITLGSRVLAWGFEQWAEAGIRVANAGAPLALLYYWRAARNAARPPDSP